MDVVRGLRQALVMLLCAVAAGLLVAGVWSGVQGGSFRTTSGIVLMVTGGLLSLSGGMVGFRQAGNEERAFLGLAPDREEPDTGPGLTGVGVFLFVSLPLFALGAVLYGSG